MNGGTIVLHHLLKTLRALGYDAFGCSLTSDKESKVWRYNLEGRLRSILPKRMLKYQMDAGVDYVKLRQVEKSPEDWIAIYPEIVNGNPTKVPNVVRWFLHTPGFHTGEVDYGPGEYHVDFYNFMGDFKDPRSHQAPHALRVVAYPFEHYNLDGALPQENRQGTAYLVRKGTKRPIDIDLSTAICVDGLPHEECARIFKRIETFVSFDVHTAYSEFAVLCGATTVVVPQPGKSIADVYPNPADRNGLAYGFDDIDRARETMPLLKEELRRRETETRENVKRFAEDCIGYFTSRA